MRNVNGIALLVSRRYRMAYSANYPETRLLLLCRLCVDQAIAKMRPKVVPPLMSLLALPRRYAREFKAMSEGGDNDIPAEGVGGGGKKVFCRVINILDCILPIASD